MMKLKFAVLGVFFLALGAPLFSADPEFSGVFDSTVNYSLYTDVPQHYFGVEEYANLRLNVSGENFTFYSAFNLVAATGSSVYMAEMAETDNQHKLTSSSFVYGSNYAAAIELERLYLKLYGEYIDVETGLLRLNFGYGQVWGSSDFLNPRNPLSINARPRGVLGVDAAFYPSDSLKFLFFTAASENPFAASGGGFIPGLVFEQHLDWASIQALYAYETPLAGADYGKHRFGLSLKADVEVGLVADALYTLNPSGLNGVEGLSVGAGFDYSFFDGNVYTLFEYLFNGSESSTAAGFGGNWSNHHYLSGSVTGRINDYTSVGYSAMYCFDDPSLSHIVTAAYEVFQGFSLNLTAQIPMDMPTPDGIHKGELGHAAAKSWFTAAVSAKLRL